MPTIAVLHETIQAQLEGEQSADARYLRLVCAASTLAGLRAALQARPAQVLVLDLAALGDPIDYQQITQTVQQLREEFRPEEVVVVYAYTSRATLAALEAAEVKLLRAPVSLSLLRSSLMSLIARELFSRDGSGTGDAARPSAVPSAPSVPLSRTVDDAIRSLSRLAQAANQSSQSHAHPSLRVLTQEADAARDNIERAARPLNLTHGPFSAASAFKPLS